MPNATETNSPDQYQGHEVLKLTPHDDSLDLGRIYDMPVYVTAPVMRTLDAHAVNVAEKDRLMWEITYMSAMNRSPLEQDLCVFRCEVGGEWRSYYAETVEGNIIISRAN